MKHRLLIKHKSISNPIFKHQIRLFGIWITLFKYVMMRNYGKYQDMVIKDVIDFLYEELKTKHKNVEIKFKS